MRKNAFTPHHFLINGLIPLKTTKKNGAGFTLIEIVTAMGIFAVLATTLTGFFVTATQTQQKTLASQELINNVSYNLEYMSRAIRMAKKDDINGVNCLSGNKVNYEINPLTQGIRFRNYKDECQEFFLAGGKLKENKNGIINDLTPASLEVVSFILSGSGSWGQDQLPLTQPKVTLFLELKGKGPKPELQPSISIQTTISQRNLNVKY